MDPKITSDPEKSTVHFFEYRYDLVLSGLLETIKHQVVPELSPES